MQSTAAAKSSTMRRRTDLQVKYLEGRTLLVKLPKRGSGKSRNEVIEREAKIQGISPAELWKRVLFAEKYNADALKGLLRLENLTWGHVRKLVTVENEKERTKFAATANKLGWSPRVLAYEIEARQGVGNLGGRRTKTRQLTPGTLHELKQEANRMLRLFTAFDRDSIGSGGLSKKDLELCKNGLDSVIEKLVELMKTLPVFVTTLKKACQ